MDKIDTFCTTGSTTCVVQRASSMRTASVACASNPLGGSGWAERPGRHPLLAGRWGPRPPRHLGAAQYENNCGNFRMTAPV